MWEEILDQLAGDDQAKRDEVWAQWTAGTPNGKPQDPIDIANMVAFLCTEEATGVYWQSSDTSAIRYSFTGNWEKAIPPLW